MRALRRRQRIARLEALIRTARALASGPGTVALGDFVEVPEGREPSGALRGFSDPAGSFYGWLARVGPTKAQVMVLVTATATDVYLTRLTPVAGGLLGAPPWAHREAVPYQSGIEAALERHRARVANITDAVRVTTLAELQAELVRVRGLTTAWRQAQPPAALLDADLRSMLGRHHDRLGRRLANRLAVEAPQARAVP